MALERVGVLGAGVMGTGVAQVVAEAGLHVVLVDRELEILERSLVEIGRAVRFGLLFGRKGPGAEEVLARIEHTTDAETLGDVHFLVDNVTERKEVREEAIRSVDRILPESCIIASNTSVMPVTWIASLTGRPAQVLGLHFMNPAPLQSMVEVIVGPRTSDETLSRALAFLEVLGKKGIVVQDSPGFVSNRVLMLAINEAIWLVHEKVASPEDVDRVFTGCMGHRTGPLQTADLIGLDTILFSLEALQHWLPDAKLRPCPLLRKKVAAGHLGRKSGQGFFLHERPSR